jgi:uncharacterized protein (DUF1330 family)|tara:strand:+ start:6889 stop:7176 length:288 start_codon:yes stop_codon:yes gene_type:complete
MSSYLVGNVIIKDSSEYRKYERRIFRYLKKHNGKLLVYDDNPTSVQGNIDGRLLIMEFPNKKNALEFWNDKDYIKMSEKYRYHCSEVQFVTIIGD